MDKISGKSRDNTDFAQGDFEPYIDPNMFEIVKPRLISKKPIGKIYIYGTD